MEQELLKQHQMLFYGDRLVRNLVGTTTRQYFTIKCSFLFLIPSHHSHFAHQMQECHPSIVLTFENQVSLSTKNHSYKVADYRMISIINLSKITHDQPCRNDCI